MAIRAGKSDLEVMERRLADWKQTTSITVAGQEIGYDTLAAMIADCLNTSSWIFRTKHCLPLEWVYASTDAEAHPLCDIPLNPGGRLEIEAVGQDTKFLDRETIKCGLAAMARNYPEQFKYIAEYPDTFLQCCLYEGEIFAF